MRLIRLDNARAIMVHNKYIHIGVFWTSADPPSRVWGGAPAEIDFGALSLQNMTSGDNNFSDFPKNQLTQFCAVQSVLRKSGSRQLKEGRFRLGYDHR